MARLPLSCLAVTGLLSLSHTEQSINQSINQPTSQALVLLGSTSALNGSKDGSSEVTSEVQVQVHIHTAARHACQAGRSKSGNKEVEARSEW